MIRSNQTNLLDNEISYNRICLGHGLMHQMGLGKLDPYALGFSTPPPGLNRVSCPWMCLLLESFSLKRSCNAVSHDLIKFKFCRISTLVGKHVQTSNRIGRVFPRRPPTIGPAPWKLEGAGFSLHELYQQLQLGKCF